MQINLNQIHKAFGAVQVLRDVSLAVAPQELFFLLGPSGCGKTTLLRMIAGFYEPDAGELLFDGRRMNGVPPHRRNTAMVFQNYALWPHLTVAENVTYGLEVRRVSKAERETRLRRVLEIVQMSAYADRTPNQLSGGQQQRVALARALIIEPDALLLDEPLSNLDAKLRLEMRDEIRRIHDETRITTIYVTHDQKEALSLADRIAVMRDGRVEQLGDPRTLYRRPASQFVAEFLGETNWFAGSIAACAGTNAQVDVPAARLTVTAPGPPQSPHPHEPVWVGFRPESVELTDHGTKLPADANTFVTRIEQVTYLGEIEQYQLSLPDGARIRAVQLNPAAARKPGETVEIAIRPENFFIIPRRGSV